MTIANFYIVFLVSTSFHVTSHIFPFGSNCSGGRWGFVATRVSVSLAAVTIHLLLDVVAEAKLTYSFFLDDVS